MLQVIGAGNEVLEEAVNLRGVEEGQSMNGGVSCVIGNTPFIFKLSVGWRNNRMCSKISEGSSDIEAGHITDSMRDGE